MIGELIAGKYRVEAEVGAGGMGQVYRARNIRNAHTVAIKVLRHDVLHHENFEERFASEVLVTSRIKHPNVIRVHDHGYLDDGRLFLALEFLVGRSVASIMKETGRFDWERALRVTREVASALEAVHETQIVHRDLKPDNIFLSPKAGGEAVKLMDFGLAKAIGDVEFDAELTQPGFAIGTPAYMAPERVTGDYDYRSDLYGLAAVCFEMLTGRPPFDGDGAEVLKEHLLTEVPTLQQRCPDARIPPRVQTFMDRGMAKDSDRRFQSAGEMVKYLDFLLGEGAAPELPGTRNRLTTPQPTTTPLPAPYAGRTTTPLPTPRYSEPPRRRLTEKQIKQYIGIAGATLVVLLLVILGVTGGDEEEASTAAKGQGGAPEDSAALELLGEGAAADEAEGGAPGEEGNEEVETEPEAPDPLADKLVSLEQRFSSHELELDEQQPEIAVADQHCRSAHAKGLALMLCVYSNSEQASESVAHVEEVLEGDTRVVVTREHELMVVLDTKGADPEGRKVQALIDTFMAADAL